MGAGAGTRRGARGLRADGLKTHCKSALVVRREPRRSAGTAYGHGQLQPATAGSTRTWGCSPASQQSVGTSPPCSTR